MTTIQGRVWKYGDNVNTDVIFPGKYTYTLTERSAIAHHALEDLDPQFAQGVQPGDVIVAGRNWGCGSSREQAATCLVYCGVGAIVAASFGRIFYRNALNNGLPAIVCPAAVEAVSAGEAITIDLRKATIKTTNDDFDFPPFSPSLHGIMAAGGLVAYVKARRLADGELTGHGAL